MEILFAKSYLHFFKFNGFEDYHNILKEFFKDSPQNEIFLELERISDDGIETFNCFKNYFKNNEEPFDEEKFEVALMSGIKKEYAETDNITEFGSKCHDLWEMLPERLSNKEPFLTLRYFDGYLNANEAKARKIMEKTLSDYNYIENYKSKESIKIDNRKERIKKEIINNKDNLKKSLICLVIAIILFIICQCCAHYNINFIFYYITSILFCGFLGMSLTFIIKYVFIKKGKFVLGEIIFAILVLIATGILALLIYFPKPAPEPVTELDPENKSLLVLGLYCIDAFADAFAETFKDLFIFLVLFFFTGPLLIADLLYYLIKK